MCVDGGLRKPPPRLNSAYSSCARRLAFVCVSCTTVGTYTQANAQTNKQTSEFRRWPPGIAHSISPSIPPFAPPLVIFLASSSLFHLAYSFPPACVSPSATIVHALLTREREASRGENQSIPDNLSPNRVAGREAKNPLPSFGEEDSPVTVCESLHDR